MFFLHKTVSSYKDGNGTPFIKLIAPWQESCIAIHRYCSWTLVFVKEAADEEHNQYTQQCSKSIITEVDETAPVVARGQNITPC